MKFWRVYIERGVLGVVIFKVVLFDLFNLLYFYIDNKVNINKEKQKLEVNNASMCISCDVWEGGITLFVPPSLSLLSVPAPLCLRVACEGGYTGGKEVWKLCLDTASLSCCGRSSLPLSLSLPFCMGSCDTSFWANGEHEAVQVR